METNDHIILGVHIHNRLKDAPSIQKIFTEFGCNIKTRLGMHDSDGDHDSINGIVILETIGAEEKIDAISTRLNSMDGVEVQKMVFTHR